MASRLHVSPPVKRYIHNYEIEDHPARSMIDTPASVEMHKIGNPDRDRFTPAEARAFAAALVNAADRAEEGS